MEQLSKEFLKGYVPQGGVAVSPPTDGMPEKVIQFGEGNFLRAFVDLSLIHISEPTRRS